MNQKHKDFFIKLDALISEYEVEINPVLEDHIQFDFIKDYDPVTYEACLGFDSFYAGITEICKDIFSTGDPKDEQ